MSDSYVTPPWQVVPPDGYRPLATHINIVLPPDVGDLDVADLVRVAQNIVNGNAGDVDQFITSSRQQSSLNQQPFAERNFTLPSMFARWRMNNGLEQLEINVYPTSTSGEIDDQPTSGTFDVTCLFTGYPVGDTESWGLYTWCAWNLVDDGVVTTNTPPYQIPPPWSAKSGVSGVCSQPITGLAYWEVEILELPAAVPASVTIQNQYGVNNGGSLDDNTYNVSATQLEYLFPQELNTWLTPAVGMIPKQQFKGFTKNTVNDDMIVGLETTTYLEARSVYVVPSITEKTSVTKTAWQGAQYTLSNAVWTTVKNASGQNDYIALGNEIYDDNLTLSQFAASYGQVVAGAADDKLNVPAQVMIDDYNPTLYQNSKTKPTIVLSPSFVQQNLPSKPLQRLGFEHAPTLGVGGLYVLSPVLETGASYPYPGAISQMPLDAFGLSDVEAGIANVQKLDWTQLVFITIPATAKYGTSLWLIVATAEHPDYPGLWVYNDYFGGGAAVDYANYISGSMTYTKGKFTTNFDDDVTIVGDYFSSLENSYPGDSSVVSIVQTPGPFPISYSYENNPSPVSTDNTINATGTHAWVLKGRGDLIANGHTASDDGPLAGPAGGGVIVGADGGTGASPNGVWSGVDLGTLQLDDIIQIAVDTSARKVWFGKNNKWYDQTGETLYQPGQKELNPAILLDGDTTQDYYPAVTLRTKSHVRFRFGSSAKYLAPVGFKPYVST